MLSFDHWASLIEEICQSSLGPVATVALDSILVKYEGRQSDLTVDQYLHLIKDFATTYSDTFHEAYTLCDYLKKINLQSQAEVHNLVESFLEQREGVWGATFLAAVWDQSLDNAGAFEKLLIEIQNEREKARELLTHLDSIAELAEVSGSMPATFAGGEK